MTIEDRKAQAFRMVEEVMKGRRPLDKEAMDFFMSVLPNSPVSIKVVSQKGICMAGYKVGDEWLVKGRDDGWKSPPICIFALGSLIAGLQLLMYGGSFPWEPDKDKVLAPCPDSRSPVVFELRRLPQS